MLTVKIARYAAVARQTHSDVTILHQSLPIATRYVRRAVNKEWCLKEFRKNPGSFLPTPGYTRENLVLFSKG